MDKQVKAAIHIMPFRDKGKEQYLVFAYDEKAYAEQQAGGDPVIAGFNVESHGKTIANIVLGFDENGKLIAINTVEK